MASISAAKVLSQRTHAVPGKLLATEHFFSVPRDHNDPDNSSRLTLFARSARKNEKPADGQLESKPLPYLLYLQGGPGFGCGPPQDTSWGRYYLDRGYEILTLDQRGTGLSTPLSASTLGLRGDNKAQVDYLKYFRADNIIRDAEAVRKALTANLPAEKQKWSIMGQSFGGFCCITYLSLFPEQVREAFVFGGLPPLVNNPDDVYARLYKRIASRNEAYYEKYPEDVDRVRTVVKFLDKHGPGSVTTAGNGRITGRRFLQAGLNFGAHGGIDAVHGVVLKASMDLEYFGHLTTNTLHNIEGLLSFDTNIIYSVLHESIYCQGKSSNWSAQRILDKYPRFKLDAEGPLYFSGEMIFPWMFEDYSELQKLRDVAEEIASVSDWQTLYDEEKLANNTVPVYAAVYMDDMYVDFDLSMETARKIKNCKPYITNMMYHNAIRGRTDEVLKGLFALRDDTID